MKSVVCAYGEVGHACLQALIELGTHVELVVTHDDAPGEKIWFSSVRDLALAAGVPVVAPADVNAPAVVARVREITPDYLFSFYFRQMMRRPLLDTARVAALNMHGSLLPRYRGRAPVNWALIRGETETGVTLHCMDEKPDHGDIVGQRSVAIGRNDTAETLTRRLATEAARLLRELHPRLEAEDLPRVPQDHARATYHGGRGPEDGRIDWSQSADGVRNLVRAVTDPWPGAFSRFRGRRLLIWSADTRPAWEGATPGEIFVDGQGAPLVATGDGALELLDVTWEGESRRSGREWALGAGIEKGARFEEPPTEAAGGGT